MAVLAFVGCSATGPTMTTTATDEREAKAEYHFAFADSLENAGAFQGAALVYKMVAELYAGTEHYANAIRNLGLLYINPFNGARNDSIALYYFTKHLEIPSLPRGERARSLIIASMIRERMQFNSIENRRVRAIDSLSSLARIQAAELNAQSKKIAELTADLEQTDNDLQILLELQKSTDYAKRDSILSANPALQKFAEATEVQQARRAQEQSEQLKKIREIDLRALQRRARR
ncbi:MAG TPA: hypothetical protein VNL69_08635 [Bacteroidota bacterium]|nr:hypothetical protein [Bacteroidota bacterium]